MTPIVRVTVVIPETWTAAVQRFGVNVQQRADAIVRSMGEVRRGRRVRGVLETKALILIGSFATDERYLSGVLIDGMRIGIEIRSTETEGSSYRRHARREHEPLQRVLLQTVALRRGHTRRFGVLVVLVRAVGLLHLVDGRLLPNR